MDPIEEVKSRIDIVGLISEYVPLKKAGRNFKALCPFHQETMPSFMISPERQIFKCFGCQKGGDIFRFIQEKEGFDFGEALEYLAQKAGVKLPPKKISDSYRQKERLYLACQEAAKFFHYILEKHQIGQKAMSYLVKRGVRKEAVEDFYLGYAPPIFDSLFRFLLKKGFPEAEILAAGLIVKRDDGSFFDVFRDRLIFPIRDLRGRIVGFSGRVVELSQRDERKEEPKYINSPQTAIFDKGNLLFGLDIAKEAIKDKDLVVLVEGEMDVISSHQAKIKNVVASKGTALTSGQVGLLSRFCQNLAICFDKDVAGDAAAKRAIELADQAGLNIKIIQVKEAKDPDELIKKGVDLWQKSIEKAVGVYDYFLSWALTTFNPQEADGKKRIGQELIPIFAKISDSILSAHYAKTLAKSLEIEEKAIFEAIDKEKKKQGMDSSVKFEEKTSVVLIQESRKEKLEEYLLALILFARIFPSEVFDVLEPADFGPGSLHKIFEEFKISHEKKKNFKKALKNLPPELQAAVDSLYLLEVPAALEGDEKITNEMVKVARALKKESLKEKIQAISKDLREAQKEGAEKKIQILQNNFREFSRQLSNLG